MQTIQMIITLNENGSIQVGGPIGNKGLCYHMLELARDAVYDWHRKNNQVAEPSLGDIAKFTGAQ